MIFQAWRSRFPSVLASSNHRGVQMAISRLHSFVVPCAPVRSSFAAALADVKRFCELGFCSAVRVFNPSNQL